MCGFACGLTTSIVGAVLVIVISVVGYAVLPGVVDNVILDEMLLIDDTIQLERFKEVPFTLNFTVRVWNISNPEEVSEGGVPIMREAGPYVYRLYQSRQVSKLEDDKIHYRILFNFEFDHELSFPHTEDDMVHVANVPLHGITQVAQSSFEALMPALNLAMRDVFGEHTGPVMNVRVGDLLMDGIRLCENPSIIGGIACGVIRTLSADVQNIVEHEDGYLTFSLLGYRNGIPSSEYIARRGLEEHAELGQIVSYNSLPHLLYWVDEEDGERGSGICNMLNGTDTGIFPPFVDTDQPMFAFNSDICRSVELRFNSDVTYEGIPAKRFTANEWFLDNHQGCFCLNSTQGITGDNGCLLTGVAEMYSCVGAYLVLSYPHFLYADLTYQNGVIGMHPNPDHHRLFIDLEPNSGTVVRGYKRAQFNIFMRPIAGIPATASLRTSLTPIIWVEEGMSLPDEFVNEIKDSLLFALNLINILVPVLIAVAAVVLVLGVVVLIRARRNNSEPLSTSTPVNRPLPHADQKAT